MPVGMAERRSLVRLILALLIALFAILTLLDRFVLIELLARRVAIPFGFAVLTALAAIGSGALVRRSLRADPLFDLIAGYPLFGAICFVIGLLRVSAGTMLPPLLAMATVGAFALWRRRATDLPAPTWSVVPLGLVLGCALVLAQAPPTSLDEVAYHLAVPQMWTAAGRAIELPLSSHSYFPLGLESADLPALAALGALQGGLASHFLHLFAAIAVTLFIARRSGSWLIAAAVATTPALAIIAGWSLADWVLSGVFVALWSAMQDDDLEAASAATAAGLLTKYTFLPFAAVAWVWKRRVPRWTAVLGGLFFVRNIVLTGNPVAPFFGDAAPHVVRYRTVALSDYVFEGTFIDEALGASALIAPAFAAGFLPFAALAMAAGLFFLAPSARILMPFLAVPVTAARLRGRLVPALLTISIALQTLLVVWFTARTGAWTLVSGAATEEVYLRRQRTSYATIEWLNRTLPARSRTLVIGLGESYWFTRPVLAGGNFDGAVMSSYLAVQSADALRDKLRAEGVTHVAVVSIPVPSAVAIKREERQTELTPGARLTLSQMLDRYAARVESGAGATLFTLR
jgi:hypothetical protein